MALLCCAVPPYHTYILHCPPRAPWAQTSWRGARGGERRPVIQQGLELSWRGKRELCSLLLPHVGLGNRSTL